MGFGFKHFGKKLSHNVHHFGKKLSHDAKKFGKKAGEVSNKVTGEYNKYADVAATGAVLAGHPELAAGIEGTKVGLNFANQGINAANSKDHNQHAKFIGDAATMYANRKKNKSKLEK